MDIFSQNKFLIKTIVLLVLLNVIMVGFFVFKETKFNRPPHPYPKDGNYKKIGAVLKKELNLTDKQVIQFEEIRKQNAEKQEGYKKIIKQDKDDMNQEMFNKKSDEEKVISLAKKIAENEYQIELLHFEQAKKLKAVCNEDQLDKFEDLVIEIRDYFRPTTNKNKKF